MNHGSMQGLVDSNLQLTSPHPCLNVQLSPWSRVLMKLRVIQLVKKLSTF